MNTFFATLGGWEIFGILAVVLILFGAKRLPELARGLGQGIKEFKGATRDVQNDLQRAIDEIDADPPPNEESPITPSETSTQSRRKDFLEGKNVGEKDDDEKA